MKPFLLALLFLPIIATAQLHVIAQSPLFEEPEDGYGRILQLRNGNTAYLRITRKDGIDVRLYDAGHKQIVNTEVNPSYGKLKSPQVDGIYDLGGNITIFLSETDDKVPTLYRLQIDAQTGKLLETKTIATLKKTGIGQGYAVIMGGVPVPDFLVRKDPSSDNYGVVRYNTFTSDRAERVELIQYNDTGEETGRNFLSSPDEKYKYTQILDFVIVGNTAHALLYSYNTESSGSAANELMLASVKDGKVSYHNLGGSGKYHINDGVLRYNPATNSFVFLASELLQVKSKGWGAKETFYYNIQFSIIDAENPSIKKRLDIDNADVSQKYNSIFKHREGGFNGMPQQLYINDDGSFTILFEEITNIYRTSNGMSKASMVPVGSNLGCVAVVTYSAQGEEVSSVLVPKDYKTELGWFNASSDYRTTQSYYIAKRDNGAAPLNAGNQFKSISYLNGKGKSYLMLNDIARNQEQIEKGYLTTIIGVGDCDAWICDLSTNQSAALPIPVRTKAFAKHSNKEHDLAIFNISDYNKENGLYATLKLEKGKGVKLVWMGE